MADAAVIDLIEARPAVILERLARAGGSTRWFHASSSDDVLRVCAMLSPGSVVSFYFDGRFSLIDLDAGAQARIRDVTAAHGDAVVAVWGEDGPELAVEIVAGEAELRDLVGGLPSGSQVLVGAFPARDDDGVDAVTLTLPDGDGIIRRHPH